MSSRKQAHHTHTLRVSSTLERITRAEAAAVPRRRAASRHRIGHNPAGRAAGRSSLPRLCSPLARSDLRLAGVASVPVEGNGETHASPDRCASRERRRRPPRESAARGGSRAIDARDGVHQRRARAPNLCSSSRPLVGRHGLDGGTGGCVLRRRRPRCRRSGGEEPEGGSANCKTLARGQGQASSSRAVFFPRAASRRRTLHSQPRQQAVRARLRARGLLPSRAARITRCWRGSATGHFLSSGPHARVSCETLPRGAFRSRHQRIARDAISGTPRAQVPG